MDDEKALIYQNIIENLSDGVIVIGFDSRVETCNDSACDMLGIKSDNIIGKTIAGLMTEIEGNDDFFELLLDAIYLKKKVSKTVTFTNGKQLKHLKVTTTFITAGNEETNLVVVVSDQTEVTNLIIRNKSLATQITALMNSFVEVMVTAVEEKSAYNANHTKNMVRYAEAYLDWLSSHGKLAKNTSRNTGPLLMSVWLHDIGKLLIPQEVMDKATRLGAHLVTVMTKLEIARLMIKNRILSGEKTRDEGEKELARLGRLEKLIISANTAPVLDEETIEQLKSVADIDLMTSDGGTTPLFSPEELEAITVARGTLTAEERHIIESHASLTAKLLSKMEFVGDYKNVPAWASAHHEYLDGTGYPKKLSGDKIPWETRLLTIIDIYDALTADDRPYKPPMSPEQAFKILEDMAKKGKIDAKILKSFIKSNAWRKTVRYTDMKKIEIEAKKENLEEVLAFIDGYLEEVECPMKKQMQIDLAVEELFVNVALYAYAPGTGDVVIEIGLSEDRSQVLITFIDSGIPYDPLAKEDPDVTLPGEERQIGGLGIFLIKQYMDDIRYRFIDGCNNLTIVKNLE